jgi:hypothetical protein
MEFITHFIIEKNIIPPIGYHKSFAFMVFTFQVYFVTCH